MIQFMDVCLFSSSIAQRAKTESYLNNINETLNLKVICRKNESKSIFLGTDRDSGKYSRLWTLVFEAIVSTCILVDWIGGPGHAG